MDEKTAIQILNSFLSGHGYIPKRLNQKNMPEGIKSPDFEVYEKETLKFLCELKTLELRPNPITNMYHWNTTTSKIREHISKAHKQFCAHDVEHKVPRVLCFISTHFQLNWTSMVHCLRGTVSYDGQTIKDMTSQRFIQATEKEVRLIDIFVWCQVNAKDKKIYQLINFISEKSPLLYESNMIVDKLTPFDDEQISDWNLKKYSNKRQNT